MKRLSTIFTAILTITTLYAQSPEKISYQAVVRDAGNALVASQTIGIQISILQSSVSGTVVYVETQTPTTNMNGLVSLEIGSGETSSGALNNIDWSEGPYFVKTEIDPDGGTNYTINGTSQIMTVPYAFHANTADSIVGGFSIAEVDPAFAESVASGITESDTARWNDHTIDTDTHIDSAGIAELGFITTATVSQNISEVLGNGNDAGGNKMVNVGSMGVGTATPNNSAALEVNSTTGTLLLPRMTTAEREALVNPVPGMVIYNTEDKKFQGITDSIQTWNVGSPAYDIQQTLISSCLGGAGQSFTASSDFDWNFLEVSSCSGEQSGTLNIYEGEGTGGNLLLSQTINVIDGVNLIGLESSISLTAGSTYTFSTNLALNYYGSDTYAGGVSYSGSSTFIGDMYFGIGNGEVTFGYFPNWVDLH